MRGDGAPSASSPPLTHIPGSHNAALIAHDTKHSEQRKCGLSTVNIPLYLDRPRFTFIHSRSIPPVTVCDVHCRVGS
jgi:hypothetical protein